MPAEHEHEHDLDHDGGPLARRQRWAARIGLEESRQLTATRAGRTLVIAVTAIALFTVVGLAALWPYGRSSDDRPSSTRTLPATVKQVVDEPCAPGSTDTCRSLVIEVEGRTVRMGPTLRRLAPDASPGDTVRVFRPGSSTDQPPASGRFVPYEFADVDRRGSLVWIALTVALLAAIVLRWRGVLAVLGVALSLVLVLQFLIPALLEGRPPLLVALVTALAVMFVTLVLTNGIGAQTLAAALGVSATLAITCLLAVTAAELADLGYATGDDLLALRSRDNTLSLRGITLAAMLIGALGVLADTAVTQASAVMALRRVAPTLGAPRLFREAFIVGRDHLSATIHTLVLAYAGATLPLLLVLVSSNTGATDTLNNGSIATPIVATAVGCLALICAVPIATGLAALLVARLPPDIVPEGHGHHH